MRFLVAAAALLAAVLFLDGCTSQDNEPYYFLPEMEMNTGALPPVSAHPFVSLKDCQAVGAQFERLNPGPVISFAWQCVRGNLHIVKPTQAPGDNDYDDGPDSGPLPGQRAL